MERVIYDRMAELADTHWWYCARRKVLAHLIERKMALSASARILEIGCGTGHSLAMLGRFGQVDAVEMDGASRVLASERLGHPVINATLPALEGIGGGVYDLVALLDVLEHVEEDRASLESIARMLRPAGCLLITVPAHPWMWSGHDVANHHKRRYTRKGFEDVLKSAGYRIEMLSYFNSLLFPLAVAQRGLARLTGREGSADEMPLAPVNAVLESVFGLEAQLVGRVPLPPGLSLVAIATPVDAA